MEDSNFERYGLDRILLFDEDKLDAAQLSLLVGQQLPSNRLTIVQSAEDFKNRIHSENFEIVVLNCDLQQLGGEFLLRQLQLRDEEPLVLVVTPSADPKHVAGLYASGCHHCIVKTDHWLNELGPAVASLSRHRRTAIAYQRSQTQLTEINRMLRDKNRRLDEFSMTIAHDIRGPLGGISMNLEFVLDTYPDELPGRSRDLLQRALETSKRLTDVVQAMYGYAKLGAKAAKMGSVPLTELVQEVAKDLHFDESLEIRLGIGELPVVWGNADLLRRVFFNLISNAVKYNDKPEIVINVGQDGIRETALARFCDVFVSDNGCGIAEADLKHIFSMFNRGGAHKNKDGLGIGLAVVQRIVELHYGKITVESALGHGTKFVISLPMEHSELLEQ